MKILFLSHHWSNNSHHSRHSGFQRIVQFASVDNDVTLVTWAEQEQEYMDGSIRVITVKSGRRDFLFRKRIAISRKGAALAPAFDAIHALYEDCTFALPPNRYTTTWHVLPGVVHYPKLQHRIFIFLKYNILQRRALRNAASIACVSTNLLAAIPDRYRSKARFIPHGVDTGFWDPALASPAIALSKTGPNYILCVGSHGLDRTLLTRLIHANPGREFIIVGLKPQLDPCPNIRYLYQLSDEALRDLYAGAAFVIRPLDFATANNSVLEALAMGKTILASRIPGITDYLTEKTAIFIDTLPNLSLENIKPLDPAHIRQTAVDLFSWQKVLAEYACLYRQQGPRSDPPISNHSHA
ncbi:MAG TPA: glycosyltransferase family 4 protein [Puia sp.]|nr:glycosyltransferase family 4 protein [Puia sp.]